MIVVTRLTAVIDLVRLSMVYYRIVNTALFIKSLAHGVKIMDLVPLIVVTCLPITWYTFNVLVLEPELRKRAHKLFVGFCINKLITYFISVTIFTEVLKNLGSQGT